MDKTLQTVEPETSGLPGILIMFAIGTVGALIIGAIYGIAMYYMNFIVLNIIVALLCGTFIAVITVLGGNAGKVNNRFTHTLFGFVFGSIAVYSSWVIWLYAISGWDAIFIQPSEILDIIVMISDFGVWSIFEFTPTGNILLTFWGLEAITIAGIASYLTGELRTTMIQDPLTVQKEDTTI